MSLFGKSELEKQKLQIEADLRLALINKCDESTLRSVTLAKTK